MKLFFSLLFMCTNTWSFVQVNPVRFNVNDSKFSYFTVRNTQSKPVNVSISNKYFSMLPDGKMIESNFEAKDELKRILFTPNLITLAPGEKQVIRFFVRDNLVGNELRTYAHILTDVKEDEKTDEQTKGTSTSLTPKVALAIPIIYRRNTQKENISFADEKLIQNKTDCYVLSKWINKYHSSYVNFEALNSKQEIVFQINGTSNFMPEYNWKLIIPNIKCDTIKRIKIFDVDNEVYVLNKEVKI